MPVCSLLLRQESAESRNFELEVLKRGGCFIETIVSEEYKCTLKEIYIYAYTAFVC